MSIDKAFSNQLREFLLQLVFIPWLAIHVPLAPKLKPLQVPLPKGLRSDLMFSMTESFSSLYIINMRSIMTGLSVR